MNKDRELLELAAKAIGMNLHVWGSKGNENFSDIDAPAGTLWMPLDDDGDALRLSVKLSIQLSHFGATHLCESEDGHYLSDEVDPEGNGMAATRRAIVRAAAEIGKAMP